MLCILPGGFNSLLLYDINIVDNGGLQLFFLHTDSPRGSLDNDCEEHSHPLSVVEILRYSRRNLFDDSEEIT